MTKAELLALSFSDFDMSGNLLHINKTYNWIIPYVTDWKGKGMDTRVSLKQALKSLGFQGGNKHDTELNQWMNHEKKRFWQRLQNSMVLNGNRKVLMRNI